MSIVHLTDHFSEKELRCKCGCEYTGMNSEFMDKLEQLRNTVGKPLGVSSAYRCPDHNAKVSNTGRDGPHTTRKAIDLRCSRGLAYEVLRVATLVGFTGVGVSQRGPHNNRFIHLDTLDHTLTRPWVWSY